MNKGIKTSYRWLILAFSVLAMLFAGILYAWSILKVPFAKDFGWTTQQLSLNFTLTMCFFCLGGLSGSFLSRKIGVKTAMVISAVLAGGGMALTGLLNGNSVLLLYITYALMAGLGIGISYNVIISTVTSWFPDKKGLCSGCLMMGFGASSLILGKVADSFFKSSLERRGTYLVLGIALFVVLALVSLLLKRPSADDQLPKFEKKAASLAEDFDQRDYTTKEMLKRFSFWRAFALLIFAAAVGNSVISFARDMAISVGAAEVLATTLVGVLAVCNGLGRIITGALFDALGRKKTMLIAVTLTVVAAGTMLISALTSSVVVCVIGLCLIGLSYGTCPVMMTSFTSAFYGQKNFSSNFSIMNCHLILASFMATACSSLQSAFDGYTVPFILLLLLAVLALIFNLSIKRP